MQIKTLEIRDRGTFIPVYVVSTEPSNPDQAYLLRRAGFSLSHPLIVMGFLSGNRLSTYDPYDWNDRTLKTAHLYVEKNFYSLKDGDVIDVEYILGETKEKKISARLEEI